MASKVLLLSSYLAPKGVRVWRNTQGERRSRLHQQNPARFISKWDIDKTISGSMLKD